MITYGPKDLMKDRRTDILTGGPKDLMTDRQTDRHMDRKTDGQT
jgi:hypothetical protein